MNKDFKIAELENQIKKLQDQLNYSTEETSKDKYWFQKIIDNLPNPLFIKNENSVFVTTNKAFQTICGLSKEELLGKTDSDFFSEEEAAIFLKVDREILANGKTIRNEESLTVENERHELITSKTRVFDSNDNKYILGVITDITDKENQNLILQLKKQELETEKTNNHTLLKEVHHRVKNNLQVVSSLLNLQMQGFEDKNVKKAFENCKNRILAMANVHEILYKTQNFSNINFATYIKTLIKKLKEFYKVDESISFDLKLVNVFLNVDIAIPLGMAINEIVINSIKHGKKENQNLNVYIHFKVESGLCHLKIGDNGKGEMPILTASENSFGTELIKLFCNQINAELNLNEDPTGKHYLIQFDKSRQIK